MNVYLEAWRGEYPYPLLWFRTNTPDDRPWKKRTYTIIKGKTANVYITSDDNLSKAECLAIATAEMTNKCQRINLNE